MNAAGTQGSAGGPPPHWTAFCLACGRPIDPRAEICPSCGVRQRMPVYPGAGERSRLAAALLAIFLGSFGAHKFYLGRIGLGVLYLVLFWTWIPGIIGFIEGILLLVMSDEEFWARYPTDRPRQGWVPGQPPMGGSAPPGPASWSTTGRSCAACGMVNAADAGWCIRCGRSIRVG